MHGVQTLNSCASQPDATIFENHLNPIMLVFIEYIVEYPQMSTHMRFSHFFKVFASFCIDQISHQRHKGLIVSLCCAVYPSLIKKKLSKLKGFID